jgi:cytoskeletal protein CcmA (bactofilin family)
MKITVTLVLLCLAALWCSAQKKVYIPKLWSTDPALSKWSVQRSYETENFFLVWGPKAGLDPKNNSGTTSLTFDPKFITDTLEYIFKKYIKEYHLISNDTTTLFGKYKTIIVMTNTWDAGGPVDFAVASQYDNIVPAMFVDRSATQDGGVISHEFAHCLQFMLHLEYNNTDGAGFSNDYGSFFFETHANFMRNHLYPVAAGYDLPRWMGTGNFQWASTRHHYDAFDLCFYIEQTDSLNMVTDLWKKSAVNETPLMTYKRLKGWTQEQLDDFMFDYAKRQVAYDYPLYGVDRVKRAQRDFFKANQPNNLWRQYVILDSIGTTSANGGRFVVPDASAPQDYGFNIIPLYPTCSSRNVFVKFKGHTETNQVTGWRYGFVTTKADGTVSRYGPSYGDTEKEISFTLNDTEANLYLVVTGAPKQNTLYMVEPGWPKTYRHPYELNIANALPESYQPGFRSYLKTNGHQHGNGGGWVSNSSSVEATVHVGAKAVVLGNSHITGNVTISGTAYVQDAVASGNVTISGNSNVTQGTYSGDVVIKDNAILNGAVGTGSATFGTNTLEFGGEYAGDVILGGDSEVGSCSTGVYYQFPNYTNGRFGFCDGKGITDPSNVDINNSFTFYTDQQMAFSGTVSCEGIAVVDTVKKASSNMLKAAIYPNPLIDRILLHIDNQYKATNLDIEIYTTAGQRVTRLTQPVSMGSSVLSLSGNGLAAGLYYMKIFGGDKMLKLKFLKQ